MRTAKAIILPSVFTALLIGGQYALSMISGVEIVTILLLSFCYRYGVKQGLLVANAFSLLRCFIFGFAPNVLVLYLVYYNLFALLFGFLGNVFRRQYSLRNHVIVVVAAVFMTVMFTMIDNVLTPVMYGFNRNAFKAYFYGSFYALVPQIVCTLTTTILLFLPLVKILK